MSVETDAPTMPERLLAWAELVADHNGQRVDLMLTRDDAQWIVENLDKYDRTMPQEFHILRNAAEWIVERP